MATDVRPVNNAAYRGRNMERIYPLILCACRFVLSLTQFSVAMDTFVLLREMNRMPEYDYDMSFNDLASTAQDYDWVPTYPKSGSMPSNYGQNKLFNLFIIRLTHFLHRQLGQLVIYPSTLSLFFMTILSVYDLFEFLQKRWSPVRVRRLGALMQKIFYYTTFLVITVQLVTMMYESSEICHMEILYPYLFRFRSNTKVHQMLIDGGVRSLKGRLVACILFNLGSLVPDTYLILVRTLQPLRLYVIINALKVAGGTLLFSTFITICIVRYFINAGTDPRLFADDTPSQLMNKGVAVDPSVANTSFISDNLKYLPVYNLKDTVYSRVARTVAGMEKNKLSVPDFLKTPASKPTEAAVTFQNKLAIYNFIRSNIAQVVTTLDVVLYQSLYLTVVCMALGLYGFVLVIKRHKLILYVNFMVDVIAACVHACHALMLMYGMQVAEYFCGIDVYMPAEGTLSLGTKAVFTWMCRSKALYILMFVIAIIEAALSVTDCVALYLLW
ncbi:hypothetical protein, conserved [Babesia bigemina]|uniref:Uncharacterized protein n=1 Tax=Babesia bigemina TaxID=5866 RepID=A0A061D360_BABBI|nr:hypothetical protein, conserved [Babesia bigemina]CDR95191.1 hypothetical protein, conserved [Babesia bigemina]|eukprot:XP_012767377.1 hypothetical protein, conserved [Babesia bigemina]